MQFLKRRTSSPNHAALITALILLTGLSSSVLSAQAPSSQQDILPFIKNAWNTLGRSMNECSSIADPKFGAGATSVLYLPYRVTAPPAVAALSECGVKVENLPRKITG